MRTADFCAGLLVVISCQPSTDSVDGGAHDGVRDATRSDLRRADAAVGEASRRDTTANELPQRDSTGSDLVARDGAPTDTGRPDSAAPDAGDDAGPCSLVPDLSPCEEGLGACFDGSCVLAGSCEDARCNSAGPRFPLPDTNQRACYDNAAAMSSCPAAGAAFFGQDAQYGWDTTHDAAERYTRDTGDEPVVADQVTGLVWQGCAAGLSGASCERGALQSKDWVAAKLYCADLSWGGHDDWTLPDYQALLSILDLGRWTPAIDAVSFPATPASYFWSSSACAETNQYAWYVYLQGGGFDYIDVKEEGPFTRCVRAGLPALPAARSFSRTQPVSGEVVVQDSVTGLMWQGCVVGLSGELCDQGFAREITWQAALDSCEGLSWGGHADWRLPDVKELGSLIDTRVRGPALDARSFPATPSGNFWTSSSSVDSSDVAWGVGFYLGYIYGYSKVEELRARCVRDGS